MTGNEIHGTYLLTPVFILAQSRQGTKFSFALCESYSFYFWLMVCFKVLFYQKFDKRMEQSLSSFAGVMNELKKTEIKRELLL